MAMCRLQAVLGNRASRCLWKPVLLLRNRSFLEEQACLQFCSTSRSNTLVQEAVRLNVPKRRPFMNPDYAKILHQETKAGYSTSNYEDAASLDKLSCDYEEVKDLLEKGKAFFVDVREPKELVNDGRIPGCVNIPLNEVGAALELPPEKFKEKYGRDKPSPDDPNVIFSCRKGVRATSAMQTAHARGYHAARFYRGSFCDWEQRGGEVIKG
ncbi:rhodanese domain-containing protein CG4456 isoform X1 [Rhipicephalus microplus]|uniref:rhodanese domain-containing protein CG4456 isoform X1 n=1 Tax=Rhipicephalus microplus TaxID=6941 RepID=UPI003F6CBFBE